MRIILLGAPGAGKGTVSKLLTAHDGSVQISSGDMLRRAGKSGTPMGLQAKAFIDRGELVPNPLIVNLIAQRLEEEKPEGFILDGFPRTIPQAVSLNLLLRRLGIHMDLVVNLDVPHDVIMGRLSTRRTCSNKDCQAIYNTRTSPAGPGDLCLQCGSPVVQRADETEEAIATRLRIYSEVTTPLIGHYLRKGILLTIPEMPSEQVRDAILEGIKKAALEPV